MVLRVSVLVCVGGRGGGHGGEIISTSICLFQMCSENRKANWACTPNKTLGLIRWKILLKMLGYSSFFWELTSKVSPTNYIRWMQQQMKLAISVFYFIFHWKKPTFMKSLSSKGQNCSKESRASSLFSSMELSIHCHSFNVLNLNCMRPEERHGMINACNKNLNNLNMYNELYHKYA